MKIKNALIQRFKAYLIEQEKSPATLEKYVRDVTAFAKWLGGRRADKRAVLEYKRQLVEDYAPTSVNSVISSLNSFFTYSGQYRLKVKTLKIQHQIFASSDKTLTKSEYNRLLAAAKSKENRRLYYLMQALCSTGMRVSEHKFITVDALKAERAQINLKGKMRVVILPHRLCKMLLEYAKRQNIKSGSVFVSKSGRPLDRSNIWRDMKKLCDDAGVSKDKVFPHNLRHLFARTYYSLQKDIVRLADILGHASVNTTRIYTIDSGTYHRAQIQKLGLLE